ncbi:MAG: phosphotransferase, partial [Myxococcales bacterium]|nr:phosphotransferase [Myxococcales bacterium]
EWLDGRMMRKRRSPAYFRKVGALTARLHLHAAAWRPPIGFERQAWDAEGLVGDSPLWGSATDLPGLSPLQIARFEEAASLVADRLDAFGTAPDRFGLIHADLHYGNVMTHGGDVFAIDFDDSGEGWFLYDMAVTLKVVRQKPEYGAARAAWLRGYRAVRPLSDEHLALLDTLMLARTICQAQWVASRRDNPRIRKYAPIMRDQVLSFADLALGA